MDLTADMVARELARQPGVECTLVRPQRWRVPLANRARPVAMFERAAGRYVQYPIIASGLRGKAEAFHIVDHSYAHIAHRLPAALTGVYCHDLDAFRSLFADPHTHGIARRSLAWLSLSGMRRAAVTFYTTETVRKELLERRLVRPERLVHASPGVSDEFCPTPNGEDANVRRRFGTDYLLHVGSCIPRKNTGFLLELFAQVRRQRPSISLVQVGGVWSAAERARLERGALSAATTQVRGLTRLELAALYRGARVVLMPSRAEGFGLPVVEALACGAPVIASDLPVFREVGGQLVQYCALNDLAQWVEAVCSALQMLPASTPVANRIAHARRFSWVTHAQIVLQQYARIRERIGAQ